jgi:hypothetical protein
MKADGASEPKEKIKPIPPAPNDRITHVQKAKLKRNQVCWMMVSYLRKVCKE